MEENFNCPKRKWRFKFIVVLFQEQRWYRWLVRGLRCEVFQVRSPVGHHILVSTSLLSE